MTGTFWQFLGLGYAACCVVAGIQNAWTFERDHEWLPRRKRLELFFGSWLSFFTAAYLVWVIFT